MAKWNNALLSGFLLSKHLVQEIKNSWASGCLKVVAGRKNQPVLLSPKWVHC